MKAKLNFKFIKNINIYQAISIFLIFLLVFIIVRNILLKTKLIEGITEQEIDECYNLDEQITIIRGTQENINSKVDEVKSKITEINNRLQGEEQEMETLMEGASKKFNPN
tara:strand:- start:340 stop:669 length:330 start_codon:yes stop_codon:yes gene_type:complete